MWFRIWHGAHTEAEAQPPEVISLTVVQVIKRLAGWFKGEWGFAKHSRMPQQLSAIGDYDWYHRLVSMWSSEVLGFSVLSVLESNIIRRGDRVALDGDPQQFDVEIGSIHATPQTGWEDNKAPEDYFRAYEALLPWPEDEVERVSLGHIMRHAEGGSWTDWYVRTLVHFASSEVVLGVHVPNDLKSNQSWTRDDLYHPMDGLTVVQPWARGVISESPDLKLTLDWDAHKAEHLRGLNESNFSILEDLLKEWGIYSNFAVV